MAAEVTGADWLAAAVAAKSALGTSGGKATHFCANPTILGQIEDTRDDLGRQIFADVATSFAGLATVESVGASQPFIFARDRCWLVINRDYAVDMSREAEGAWKHYATSLRVVARFGLAVPKPSKACRKLAVSEPAARATAKR